MRRGDAKHRRAARKQTFAGRPWSARAEPARAPREAQLPYPSESAAFARVSWLRWESKQPKKGPSS